MKTIAILTAFIPSISAVRNGGVFNNSIPNHVGHFVENITSSAEEDRIDISSVLSAVEVLVAAKEFEEQQLALADLQAQADLLLGQLRNGTAPAADPAKFAIGDLVLQMRKDVLNILDVFNPDREIIRRIRTNASELTALVEAEILEKKRAENDAITFAQVFDCADRIQSNDYLERDAASREIQKHLKAIAA